ncbi:SRPBCC family protein [Actinomadura scrupuli]|uniref:SRPBCC family protein n=1 Tax=Actinomadura scrupuli TaxID=559629 RepID=UPI003D98D688
MAMLTESTLVDAPAEAVWALIRDFNGLSAWATSMPPSVIEDGKAADQVGCVRRLEANGTLLARERLLALDDVSLTQKYAILESALGVNDYVGTLHVTPVTDGDRSVVEWSGSFRADAAEADKTIAVLRDQIYRPGLAALKERFSG